MINQSSIMNGSCLVWLMPHGQEKAHAPGTRKPPPPAAPWRRPQARGRGLLLAVRHKPQAMNNQQSINELMYYYSPKSPLRALSGLSMYSDARVGIGMLVGPSEGWVGGTDSFN